MKNILNRVFISAFFIVALIFNLSCSSGLEGTGYQDSPNNTGYAPSGNILGLAELAAGSLVESDNSRYAAVNAGYISGLSQQFAPINNYVYSPGDFDGLWTTIYQDGLKPAKLAEAQGESEGDDEMVGTAKLLQAIFLMEAASNWGDVPSSEAVVPGIIAPKYDAQNDVYLDCLDLLNAAITKAGTSTKYFNDGIGGTETTSTISEIANSLKARLYLLMKDYANAEIAAQNGIQNPAGDLILGHSDLIGAKNMYYQFLVDQRGGYIGPNNSYLEKMLNSADVSVVRTLATPGDANRYNYYYTSSTEFNTTINGIFGAGTSSVLISYNETKLIEAEAAYRNGSEARALNALNAVRDNLATFYGGSFPHSSATGTALLTHILEEKYITLFPTSNGFHDLSRTNNMLNVVPNAGTELPKRFLYSQSEIDANDNVPDPIPGIFVQTPANN